MNSTPSDFSTIDTATPTSTKHTVRSVYRTLAATLAALALVLIGASHASADITGGSGAVAGYSVPTGSCKYNGVNGTLTISVAPPQVYAKNVYAGANNDSAYIRYRVFAVDANTGNTIASSGYSGYGYATDVTPARFSGSTAFSQTWRGNYRLVIRIEWWNSTQLKGWLDERLTRYNYYNQYNAGPYGPMSSCAKF
jgi:hypothetical protein